MSITKKDVEHIAALAKLKFSEEEKEKFLHQLNVILEYIDQLNEVPTDNVEPLHHAVELSNVMRDDRIDSHSTTEEALKNAPQRTEQFFKVPKVIGE